MIKPNGILIKLSSEVISETGKARKLIENFIKNRIFSICGKYEISFSEDKILIKGYSEKCLEKLRMTLGVSEIAPGIIISNENDIKLVEDYLENVITSMQKKRRPIERFVIKTKSSMLNDIIARIRSLMLSKGLREVSEESDLDIYIETINGNVIVYVEKLEAPEGFPPNIGPKAVCLMSGGPDSTLATLLVARLGCKIIGIYFDFGVEELREQARLRVLKVVRRLSRDWGLEIKLYVVPFSETVSRIASNCKPYNFFVLLKRFMLRTAEIVASKEKAQMIVTGEIIGEHASQTLHNLRIISSAISEYPIVRPVANFDKETVFKKLIKMDKELYNITASSIEPCRLFLEIKPTTKAKMREILGDEERIGFASEDLGKILEECIVITP